MCDKMKVKWARHEHKLVKDSKTCIHNIHYVHWLDNNMQRGQRSLDRDFGFFATGCSCESDGPLFSLLSLVFWPVSFSVSFFCSVAAARFLFWEESLTRIWSWIPKLFLTPPEHRHRPTEVLTIRFCCVPYRPTGDRVNTYLAICFGLYMTNFWRV